MSFYFIGEACRDTPADGKGCHYWTYFPDYTVPLVDQNRTCFLLNSCANFVVSNSTIVSGNRDCDPLNFILALGETLAKNIVALKKANAAIEAVTAADRKRTIRAAASDCTEFIAFVNMREFFFIKSVFIQ